MVDLIRAFGASGIASTIACGLITCSPFVVLTVFFGIYAFDNPDKEAWYGVKNEEQALYADKPEA